MPPTIPPAPVTPLPTGPLAHFLAHPGALTSQLVDHLSHLLVALGLVAAPVLAGAVLAVGCAVVLVRGRQRARLADGARSVRVLAAPEVDPNGALTLWTNLVALLRPAWRRVLGAQPHLAFELTAGPGGLTIALWVPAAVPPGMVERAIEAAWPGARTETTGAVAPLPGGAAATGGELRLGQPEHYPIRTDHQVDPLRPLLGALSGLEETETACVQVLARPVTGRRLTRARRAASLRRSGLPSSRLARLVDLVTPGPSVQPPALDPSRGADVAAILGKAAEPCWAATIRYAIATTDGDPAARARLRGRAHALASAFALFSGRNRFDRHRLTHPATMIAARRLGRGDLVSVSELATLAHLPTDPVVVGLARAGAKAVAPPPVVATAGVATAGVTTAGTASVKVLGEAETGARRPITLAVADARHHLHVMGATGSGKSTLLTNLVLGDIEAGRGVVVIDPKGDLVTDICARMPDGSEDRVVLIDPEEREAPPVMNVLSGPDPDLVTDNLVGIFRSIFSAFWGPRTDDVMRAACLTLLRTAPEGSPASLADVPRLLADEEFRQPLVAQVLEDAVGLGGFWKWYEQMGDASRAQVIGPLMNKLRAFLLRDFVRQVVGRAESSFDMGDVLDGGICLVRVPKGTLGEETSRLLGSFVVAKVWQAATHRARLGGTARADAALYVDEAQNFLNLPRSFDEMLAEARGYGLSMTLAHQHLAQLPKDLRDAVSANARTKVLFSMSPEDAHVLARHVAPEISEHDLSHLGAYQAAARLVVGGEETPAFTMRTRPARPATLGRLEQVRLAARAKGRPASVTGAAPIALRTAPEEMARPHGSTPAPASADTTSADRASADGASADGARPGQASAEPAGAAEAVPDTGGRDDARGVVSGLALSYDPAPLAEQAGRGAGDGSSGRADLVGERGDVSW